ncbi:hypothetical protein [Kitasatospora sp. NPDC004289]
MSTNRSRRIDRDTAEQLLAGASGARATGPERLADRTAPPGHAELAGLLASAAAPEAGGGEQPGEQAALAAFRAVRTDPSTATTARRTTVSTTVRVRAFSAKALLTACAATALGGVAVAAGTGGLPHIPGLPGGGQAAHAPATPSASGSAGTGARTGTSPSHHEPQGFGVSHAATAPPSGSAAPSAIAPAPASPGTDQRAELCHQLAVALDAGGKRVLLLAEPRFAPLLAAAGGADGVAAYCAAPAADQDGKASSHGPELPALPSATASSGGRKATEKPAEKPGGKPTDKTSEKPTAKQDGTPEEQRTAGQPEQTRR